MARSFSVSQTDNQTKTGTIAVASGVVGPYRYRRIAGQPETIRLQLAGTWSGTMQLQTSTPDVGQWVTQATYAGNTSDRLELDGSLDIRVICSAYTSGTCYVGLIST